MKLTRRQLLAGGAAGAALGAAGIYELVDQLSESPPSHFGEGRDPEQHLLDGMQVKDHEGVEVVVPTVTISWSLPRSWAPKETYARHRRRSRTFCGGWTTGTPGRPTGLRSGPAAGLRFVVFSPSSDDFHRNRLAMDGVLPDGEKLPFPPRAPRAGL